ncbi:MAG: YhdH/YhfP family quinone oxidoreductase [bacterium]
MNFKALVVREIAENRFERRIEERSIEELPAGEVLIRVKYSSLNYKDALSATGHKGVSRDYPHTPGIDASGIVVECDTGQFAPEEEVIVTGYRLGMDTDGGFGQYIRVPASWVVKRPQNLSLREAMIYGTAGFTAGQCLLNFEMVGIKPEMGEVLVTGATGGVGSLAVAILAKAGYSVVAATGKMDQQQFLLNLGAKEVIHREEINDTSGRPLLKARWAGVVDTVGGNYLSTAVNSTMPRGAVAACGLVDSDELKTTVYPFILRGVKLLGINSADCPMEKRIEIWHRLANEWKPAFLEEIAQECSLEQMDEKINMILEGKIRGRIVLRHRD